MDYDFSKTKISPCCGIITEKIDGCNFMHCICGKDWCWECVKIKGSGCQKCNDRGHNSH